MGGVADIDAGDLESRARSPRRPGRAAAEQRGKHRSERPDRIVGDLRVGDVALAAVDEQPSIERAAPAVLDRVAESAHACRLADDAMIETLTLCQRPVEQLDLPLTAGPSSSPVMRKLIEPANGALAMKRKAAATAAATPPFMSQAPRPKSWTVGDLGCERIEPPALDIAGRDDVGMAGESEIWPAGPEPGAEVQDRRRPGRLEGDELGCESSPGQEIAQIGQRPAVLGVTERQRISAARSRAQWASRP